MVISKWHESTMYRLALLSCLLLIVRGSPPRAPVHRTRSEIEQFQNYLEKTKNGDGLRLSDRMASNPMASEWENSGRFQGDIVLDEPQVKQVMDQYVSGRNARSNTWPDKTVYYYIFEEHFNTAQLAGIADTMRNIEQRTCVKFLPKGPDNPQYINVTGYTDGCYAHVGFWRSLSAHIVNLANNISPPWGCHHPGVVNHELFHTLGLHHMHSTYNRDEYVEILHENIQDGVENAFTPYSSSVVSNLGLEYEYVSNMHYNAFAFSKNGQPTIRAIQPFDGVMGQRDRITDRDWLRINRLYDCPGAWDPENEV